MIRLFHTYNFNGEKIIPTNTKIWSKPKVTKHRIRNTVFMFTIFLLVFLFLFNIVCGNLESNCISTSKYPSESNTEVLIEPINIIDIESKAIDEYEYETAFYHAVNYSEILHLSKAKIYEKLTTESDNQFSFDSVHYALDNINANWKENALNNAKEYVNRYKDVAHLSKEHIYYVLTSKYGEKFTEEEAQYAIDNLNMKIN